MRLTTNIPCHLIVYESIPNKIRGTFCRMVPEISFNAEKPETSNIHKFMKMLVERIPKHLYCFKFSEISGDNLITQKYL